jgi:SAM-dependent methyltransferase
MRPDDVERLRDDLLNYRIELEAPEVRAALLQTAWPRLLPTLELIPDRHRSGDVLELGSLPFFLTLCLRRWCKGRLTLANYFGQAGRRDARRLVHRRTGEELVLEFDLFNVESDDFPYPDGAFDVVVFCELIEHLAVNPVRALSEMHRVLRPGGILIVTTPNSLSLARLESFLIGGVRMVDRYSPSCGYGARHNREYHPGELRELLEGTGFAIEEMLVRDITPIPRLHRWHRRLWKGLLALYSRHPRAEHVFLRARRGEAFRWHFPPSLFDNTELFTLVRYPWVEMGRNDGIQCAGGWHPPESSGERGDCVRWIKGPVGQGFLKAPGSPRAFGLECFASPLASGAPLSVRLILWDRWLGRVDRSTVYLDKLLSVPRGQWQRIELPIDAERMPAGNEVEVRLELDPDQLTAAASAPLAERERGLAVRRFWLAGDY